MKTKGSGGTMTSRQRDKVEVATAAARVRRGDVENSHLQTKRVVPTDSHRKRLADQTQFRAPTHYPT